MSREHVLWAVVVMLLLFVGLLIGQYFTASGIPDHESFRPWFWENRGLDLVAQACLIFAGALGIAALLPGEKEQEGE